MSHRLCVGLLAVAITLSAPALAQAQSLSGSITGSVSADDNILAAPANEISDEILGVSGNLAWKTESEAGSFSVYGDFDLQRYQDNEDENADDYTVGAKGRVTFDGGAFFAGASTSQDTTSRRNRTTRRDTRERTEYATDAADVGFDYGLGWATLTGQASVTQLDFEDGRLRTTNAVVDQDFRDRQTFSQALSLSGPSEAGSWFLRLKHDDTEYDNQPPAVAANRNSETWTFSGGYNFDLDRNVSGSIDIGVKNRVFEQVVFDDVTTVYADVDVKWEVSPTQTVRLALDRDVVETQLANSPYYIATVLSGSFNQTLGGRFGIRLSVAQEWDDHENIARTDEVLSFGIGLTADITDNVQAAVTYTSSEEDSEGAQRSPGFDSGVIFASIGLTF